MPRGPNTSKRQQGAANQRDTRHENGLVGPGKRVQKQKSNGHLNGHVKSPESNSSTPPLPGTPPATNGHARQSILGEQPSESKILSDVLRRSSVSGYSDSSSDAFQQTPTNATSQENHRQIDVSTVKNADVHRDPMAILKNVLTICPLWDTLAILIVLLQIPPTFLSIVHLLFATLTFVPSSSTSTSGFSWPEILQGTLSTPSVGTIFLVDMVVLLMWLFLSSNLQDVALDLAQSVIALTLGGGTSAKNSGSSNVVWCLIVIWVSHVFRNSNPKQSGWRALVRQSLKLGSPDPDDPLEPRVPNGNKRHGLIRSILAIHILTQGVVRYIRDWYVRREKRDLSASIGDPEAGKPTLDASDSTLTTTGAETDVSLSHGSAASSKRKKKHSAEVRLAQPLWAALASTKVVMIKEYETSHTAAESAGTNATDTNNLGNAPFNSEADKIWITFVGSDEVHFDASYFATHTEQRAEEKDTGGIDRSKPFYVKVNTTTWAPTRIQIFNDPASPQGQESRWSGKIVGLTSSSDYTCEFFSTIDDSIIFSTTVQTGPSATTDPAISPNAQITGRPGSPTTTLKKSIATENAKLSEERVRQKREKRDQQKKLSVLKKEIDRLANGLTSTGGNDDKLKQKAQQNQLQMKHADELTTQLEAQIQELDDVPIEEASLYMVSKKSIQSEREQHKKHRSELNAAKQKAERHLEALKDELKSIQQKCDGKQTRVSQLISKHESLTNANAQGLDEVQRKESEREAKQKRRNQILSFYNERLKAKHDEVNEGKAALAALDSAIQTLQQAIEKQLVRSPAASNLSLPFGADVIPEGVTSNYPWNPMPATSGPWGSPFAPMRSLAGPSNSPHGSRNRGRSSSMLSDVSGFTESDDGDDNNSGPSAPGKGLHWEDARERKGSSGTGSGSGSKSGSVSDPRSPVMANSR